MVTANSPENNCSKDCRASKVEVDIEVSVKMIMLELGFYLSAFLTAIIKQFPLKTDDDYENFRV